MDTLCREHVEVRFETALAAKPAPVVCGSGPSPKNVHTEPTVKGPAFCISSIENVRPIDHGCLIFTKAGSLKHIEPVGLFEASQ